jgi:hypothetical protein
MIERFHAWMWGFAERMDYSSRFPRILWARLLRYYDKRAGYDFEYDEGH